jgi:Ctr copper transporter family
MGIGSCHCGPGELANATDRYTSTSDRMPDETNHSNTLSRGMQMVFTNSFIGAPILFEQWAPKTPGAFVGSMIAIVIASFCMRFLIFVKSFLNSECWSKSTVVV